MRVGQRKTDSESGTVDDRQGERDSGGQTVRVGQWMTDNEWDSGGQTVMVGQWMTYSDSGIAEDRQ